MALTATHSILCCLQSAKQVAASLRPQSSVKKTRTGSRWPKTAPRKCRRRASLLSARHSSVARTTALRSSLLSSRSPRAPMASETASRKEPTVVNFASASPCPCHTHTFGGTCLHAQFNHPSEQRMPLSRAGSLVKFPFYWPGHLPSVVLTCLARSVVCLHVHVF